MHAVVDVAPRVALYVPAMHSEHVAALPEAHEPPAHCKHDVAPASLK